MNEVNEKVKLLPNITITSKRIASNFQVSQIDTFRFKWPLCCVWIGLLDERFVIAAHINRNVLHSTQLAEHGFRNSRNRCIV